MSVDATSSSWPLIPVANTPLPHDANADLTSWFVVEMALAHNIMIRAINSMWRNAPLITPQDEIAFSGYALACLKTIHSHHDAEESIIFPHLQKKLDMKHNVEQHEVFHAPLEEIETYFMNINTEREKHEGEKTRRLLKAFADPLVVHLVDELDTLTPEKMSVFTQKELAETNKALEAHLKEMGGLFTVLPFGLTAHDPSHAPHWPPIPSPVKWFALNVGYFVNRSYWKFSPFSRHGVPQTYTP